jgi:hypothetical protein
MGFEPTTPTLARLCSISRPGYLRVLARDDASTLFAFGKGGCEPPQPI